MTRVFEPPPSTPATTSVIRMPCPVTVRERRSDSDEHRYRSADQDIPGPRDLGERRENAGHSRQQRQQLLRENDKRHHHYRRSHSKDGISLDCPSPQHSKEEAPEQRAIRERRDREGDHHDRRTLLSV